MKLFYIGFISFTLVISGCVTAPQQAVSSIAAPETIEPTAGPVDQAPTLVALATATPTQISKSRPAIPTNLWQRLEGQLSLQGLNHPRVDKELKWLQRNPAYVERLHKNGKRYLHYIVSQTEARHMPGEIALLPMVESGYDPFAHSSGNAVGLWQFISSTGKGFGLKQSWWKDDRRDVLQSTQAALDYLQSLHKKFDGDWLHALAAYNCGGACVRRAIRKNEKSGKPTDFWSLRLPLETRRYVPRLLAASRLLQASSHSKNPLTRIANQPYFTSISTEGQIDLSLAAEMAGVSAKELYLLNPASHRWALSPDGPHRLLIPVDHADKFRNNLAALPAEKRLRWNRHKIRSGDNLGAIALKYGTSISNIKRANKLKSNRIRIGRYLVVPLSSGNVQIAGIDNRVTARRTTHKRLHKYKVRSGDTLSMIAARHRVSTRSLASRNRINNRSHIRIGQILSIPVGKPKTANAALYTVKPGDSLYLISKRYNVSINSLRSWNTLRKNAFLQPGQELKVAAGG